MQATNMGEGFRSKLQLVYAAEDDAVLSYRYCKFSTCIQLITGHVNCFGQKIKY